MNSTGIANPIRGPFTIIGALVLWILVSVAAYIGFIRDAGRCDFCSIWSTPRLLITQRMPLYTVETNHAAQILDQGHLIPPGENQQWFVNPAIAVPLMLPFWLIPSGKIAAAVLVGLSAVMFAATIILMRRANNPIPAWGVLLLACSAWTLSVFFATQTMAISTIVLAISFWAYRDRQDRLAGSVLPVAMIKPELALVPAAVLIILTIRDRRWVVLISAAVSCVIIFAASLLMAGWWVDRWLVRIREYSADSGGSMSIWPIEWLWQTSPLALLTGLAALAGAMLLVRHDSTAILAVSVATGMLVLPQTMPYALGILLIPMAYAWRGKVAAEALTVWLFSWLSYVAYALVSDPQTWWPYQMILSPLSTIAAVVVASRGNQPNTQLSALDPLPDSLTVSDTH